MGWPLGRGLSLVLRPGYCYRRSALRRGAGLRVKYQTVYVTSVNLCVRLSRVSGLGQTTPPTKIQQARQLTATDQQLALHRLQVFWSPADTDWAASCPDERTCRQGNTLQWHTEAERPEATIPKADLQCIRSSSLLLAQQPMLTPTQGSGRSCGRMWVLCCALPQPRPQGHTEHTAIACNGACVCI